MLGFGATGELALADINPVALVVPADYFLRMRDSDALRIASAMDLVLRRDTSWSRPLGGEIFVSADERTIYVV